MELIKTKFASRGLVVSRIGGRSENQDYFGFCDTPIGQVVVVCDGMGGMQGGRIASTTAVNSILESLAATAKGSNVEEALEKAIQKANQDIIAAGNQDPNLYGMGTTVTALILNKKCATVAYVGDSRVYQLRGRRKIFRTFDHSMVFDMVKNGMLTEEQARLSEQSNIILKALGVFQEITPNIYRLPYLKGDRFLLCTDGFWGAMPEKEFLRYVTRKRDKMANVMETTANEVERIGLNNGGTHDNLTAAIVEVKNNSLMKEKMRKEVKATIAALILLLAASVSLNIYQMVKFRNATMVVTEQSENGNEKPSDTEAVEDNIKMTVPL